MCIAQALESAQLMPAPVHCCTRTVSQDHRMTVGGTPAILQIFYSHILEVLAAVPPLFSEIMNNFRIRAAREFYTQNRDIPRSSGWDKVATTRSPQA